MIKFNKDNIKLLMGLTFIDDFDDVYILINKPLTINKDLLVYCIREERNYLIGVYELLKCINDDTYTLTDNTLKSLNIRLRLYKIENLLQNG